MQNSTLFTAPVTPIHGRSHSRHEARRYPRSSTPSHGVNTQQAVVQKKSSRTDSLPGRPDRKRKSSTDEIGVAEKAARCEVTADKSDKITSKVASRSYFKESLAGKLQQQKHRVIDI